MLLPSRPEAPDGISVGGRDVVAGGISMSATVATAQGSAVPLKGGDPHDVVQNGQELVHASAPLRRIRLPLAFILKRV